MALHLSNRALRNLAIAAALAVVALAAVAGGSYALLVSKFESPGPLASDTVVHLPPGTSLKGIARILADNGAITSRWVFVTGATLLGDKRVLRAGEYQIAAHASMGDIVALLKEGRTVVHKLTIPEGLTTPEVLALVSDAGALKGDVGDAPGEGRLLPETYFYSYGDSRHALVQRMAKKMDETLHAAWENRAEDLPIDTPDQALVLASMVEKETAKAGERPEIAGVFMNRLRKGMKLQSDPTVIFALTDGERNLDRPLSKRDLETDSPYNTYVVNGLPPGPIANPGREAIEAVMHPADTDDLYFVSDGEGGHVFSRTLAEHNRNVAKLRRAEKRERETKSKDENAETVKPSGGSASTSSP